MMPTENGLVRMTNKDFAAALREIADLYERDERMVLPPDFDFYLGFINKEAIQGVLRALATDARVDKLPPRDKDDFWYRLRREFAGVQVTFSFPRDAVCKRVQKMQLVETWECPEAILESEEPNAEAL